MATIVATLNAASPGTQADDVTTDVNLTYKVYNDTDSYAVAEAFGSHVTDADVTVAAGVVTITNVVEPVGVTAYKISSVDEAGNESVLSAASGSSIVVFSDDFTGTTIDETATGWTVTNPADGVDFAQNGVLQISSDRDQADVASTLPNSIETKQQVPTTADYTVAQINLTTKATTPGSTATFVFSLRAEGDNGYSADLYTNGSNFLIYDIYVNSVKEATHTSAIPCVSGMTVKIAFNHTTNQVGFYYYNSGWVLINALETQDISAGGTKALGFRMGQNSIGSITTGVFTNEFDDFYLSNNEYTGGNPTV